MRRNNCKLLTKSLFSTPNVNRRITKRISMKKKTLRCYCNQKFNYFNYLFVLNPSIFAVLGIDPSGNCPIDSVCSSLFHQHQQRVFVERLFYLVLNNVELTHFSTFNVNSILIISKELEKYQQATNKTILNTGKLNTVIQFVLSFSSASISSFQLNNLFYLLLNDMNDFSGKIIDRIADLLRLYHAMTYGHAISKQYLIATVSQLRSGKEEFSLVGNQNICFSIACC